MAPVRISAHKGGCQISSISDIVSRSFRLYERNVPVLLVGSLLLGFSIGIPLVVALLVLGFGGTFAAKFPMISTAMGEVKCASACETKAEYIVSNDSSCLMHIQGLIDRQRIFIRTIHLAEVLVSE